MQPIMMDALQAVAAALGTELLPVDTHSAANALQHPRSQPDCTWTHIRGQPTWATAVTMLEAKLGDGARDIHIMWGQQTDRCQWIFDNQPSRTCIISAGLTLNNFELIIAQRSKEGNYVRFSRAGPLPFSFHSTSLGFSLLVRLMATSASQQGFCPILNPALADMGAGNRRWQLSEFAALRPASSQNRSCLFTVAARAEESAHSPLCSSCACSPMTQGALA